jgi:hypothetical protein
MGRGPSSLQNDGTSAMVVIGATLTGAVAFLVDFGNGPVFRRLKIVWRARKRAHTTKEHAATLRSRFDITSDPRS